MLSPLRKRAGKRLREPFGKAGLTVAVIALVFAMLGGAYAASGLNSKQKKEVKAIAKGLQGTGPAGAAGPQGPAGANGKDGSNGSNGSSGGNGESVVLAAAGSCGAPGGTKLTVGGVSKEVCNGAPGAPGESVEAFPFEGNDEPTELNGNPVTHPCHEQGGVTYEVAGEENIVCNGAQGAPGPQGEPWTLGGTLPEGKTEKGSFAISTVATEPSVGVFSPAFAYAPISFPIPLAKAIEGSGVHLVVGTAGPECSSEGKAGVTSTPRALPGNLCVFLNESPGYSFNKISKVRKGTQNTPGALTVGADVVFNVTAPGEGGAFGTWAVTAFKTPVVTEISPNHGPAAGGTSVTIKGENLTGATEVLFGSTAATGTVTVTPDGKEITGLSSPAGSGEVDVTVKSPGGTSATSAADKYTYE